MKSFCIQTPNLTPLRKMSVMSSSSCNITVDVEQRNRLENLSCWKAMSLLNALNARLSPALKKDDVQIMFVRGVFGFIVNLQKSLLQDHNCLGFILTLKHYIACKCFTVVEVCAPILATR